MLLRDTDADAAVELAVQPTSVQMPDAVGRSASLQLLGEIARGGMGVVSRAAIRTWAATWPSRCCWTSTGTADAGPAVRRGGADRRASSSTRASCRSTSSARSPTAGRTSR